MKKELNKTKSVFVKKSKMSLAKSTTALTCLISSLIIVSSESGKALTTSSGGMEVSGSVASVCSVSGATMAFDPYVSSTTITATSEITVNCSTGTAYTISLATTPNLGSFYYLTRSGSPTPDAELATNQLRVTFTNGAGTTLTNGVTAMTGTGSGTTASAGEITGTMASGQNSKTAGTFNKTMTLNIVY